MPGHETAIPSSQRIDFSNLYAMSAPFPVRHSGSRSQRVNNITHLVHRISKDVAQQIAVISIYILTIWQHEFPSIKDISTLTQRMPH